MTGNNWHIVHSHQGKTNANVSNTDAYYFLVSIELIEQSVLNKISISFNPKAETFWLQNLKNGQILNSFSFPLIFS